MAKTSTFTLKSHSYDGRYLYVTCAQTKNTETNKNRIDWTLTATGGSHSYYDTGPTTLKIGGKIAKEIPRKAWNSYAFPAAKGSTSGYVEIDADTDGTCEVEVSLSTAIYTGTVSTVKGTWELEDIPRGAKIKSAPNFTDEQNPTIIYENLAGDSVDALEACITDTEGSVKYAAYRNISKTSDSYTFELTDTERSKLQAATPDSNTLNVRFYVKTTIGDNVFHSYLPAQLTVINNSPTLTVTVEASDQKTADLTGDATKSTFIRYISSANYTITATAVKSAKIKRIAIQNGALNAEFNYSGDDQTATKTVTGTLSGIESSSFLFTTTDTRDNPAAYPELKNIIEYVRLTCNLQASNPNAEGEMVFKIKGNYFNGSFGSVVNTLSLYFRYKENNSEYGEWIPIESGVTYDVENHTYEVTVPLTGLNYQSMYTFQAKAEDKIEPIESNAAKVKAITVFDWSDEDFNFNVPVNIEGSATISGKPVALLENIPDVSGIKEDFNRVDLDTLTTEFVAGYGHNLVNSPVETLNQGHLISVPRHDVVGYVTQYFSPYPSNDIYMRQCSAGTWGSWKKLGEKNIITVGLSADTTYKSSVADSYTFTVPLNTVLKKIGDKLTLDTTAKAVKIGAGVSKVLVSGMITQQTTAAGLCGGNIHKNTVNLAGAINIGFNYIPTTNQMFKTAFHPVLVDVTEGDLIYLSGYTANTGTVTLKAYNGRSVNLTVEVVE